MIKIGPFKDLEADDLVGKIVFKYSQTNWLGASEPFFVTEKSCSRLYISRLVPGGKSPLGGGIPNDCIGVSWGYMGVSTVSCVCDTVEEANTVVRKLAEVRALDGMCIGDSDRFVPQEDLPLMARTAGPSGKVNLQGSPWSRHIEEADGHAVNTDVVT